ncbi:hypothetical protein L249_5239 [Ophiocordyceps polyrhachis-furcata BCC 54312]|uniref:Tyrosine specific protein phosphatases domain-containing protein n=1 Tax=Ophiocordyceps polyrhachis-furcata BCC 54312 TaxID=1330021 RepID=A0A367L8C4_9HYPO|nr:hypothetical protein L249_5239 [Ophiocordyceps polyrhachis-furcata BCC 54312]
MHLLPSLLLLLLSPLLTTSSPSPPGKNPLSGVKNKVLAFFSHNPPPRACPGPSSEGAAPFDIAGLHRFEWVVDGVLARSSAPYYRCRDGDQHLTGETMTFLKRQSIKHIISLNVEANNKTMSETIRRAKIDYTPIPVRDFHSPTFADFNTAFEAFRARRSARTLVWCGYGNGRTGTLVVALLMYLEHHKPRPRFFGQADYRKYHVETAGQVQALDRLQAELTRRRAQGQGKAKGKDVGGKKKPKF